MTAALPVPFTAGRVREVSRFVASRCVQARSQQFTKVQRAELPSNCPQRDEDPPATGESVRTEMQVKPLILTGERTLPGITHENYWVKLDLFTGVRACP